METMHSGRSAPSPIRLIFHLVVLLASLRSFQLVLSSGRVVGPLQPLMPVGPFNVASH